MEEIIIPVDLVIGARSGKKDCLDRLSDMVWAPLRSYIYRRILDHNLTEDIVQESIIEMFKILGKLRKNDRFWPWLCKIALNKIRIHNRSERRRKSAHKAKADHDHRQNGYKEETVANLVNEELKQSVVTAMRQIKLRHREVLAMRCYESKEYAQIADDMGCSELGARLLFYRAKKSLARQLARNGLGRGSLLLALVVIGKLSAPSKAAAAAMTISAGTMNVGIAAGLIGAATTTKGVAVVATAAAVTVSSVAVVPNMIETQDINRTGIVVNSELTEQNAPVLPGVEQCSYYFPQGVNGPVITRQIRRDEQKNIVYSRWLQNDSANYCITGNRVLISNHRMWAENLSVCRLPTDSVELRRFLSSMEGKSSQFDYPPCISKSKDLLITIRRDDQNNNEILQAVRHYNISEEEYFLYDWPKSAKIIDNRDDMHKRGWTYFAVTGRVNGMRISGQGRIAFVYEASQMFKPWIRLKIGNNLEIVDTSRGAAVSGANGKPIATYPAGTFMKGLARPWGGLHTIDVIRRDAAKKAVPFQSRYISGNEKTEVILSGDEMELVYTIDMQGDIVEKIAFVGSETNDNNTYGEDTIQFTYLQDIDQVADDEFATPVMSGHTDSTTDPGQFWLFRLGDGSLAE